MSLTDNYKKILEKEGLPDELGAGTNTAGTKNNRVVQSGSASSEDREGTVKTPASKMDQHKQVGLSDSDQTGTSRSSGSHRGVSPSPTLVKKLAAVMAAVKNVEKDGYNSFHKYNYASEAAIVAAVRQELASRHVMMTTSIRDAKMHKGDKGIVTELWFTFTFHDGESGECLSLDSYAQGIDASDKGVYKAITGAVKYALLKTFLIPTGAQDDPEVA